MKIFNLTRKARSTVPRGQGQRQFEHAYHHRHARRTVRQSLRELAHAASRNDLTGE